VKSIDYAPMKDLFRPSHADFTYQAKYGIRNWMGGGRASARETVGRVAAGAIARKLLRLRAKTEILGYVRRVHAIEAAIDPSKVRMADVERNIVRCPDPAAAEKMIAFIEKVRNWRLVGVVELVARNVPGLGEPAHKLMPISEGLMPLRSRVRDRVGRNDDARQQHNDPFAARGGGPHQSNRSAVCRGI
jgi:chorismate synthase